MVERLQREAGTIPVPHLASLGILKLGFAAGVSGWEKGVPEKDSKKSKAMSQCYTERFGLRRKV